jgi:hypothetical protein
LTKGAPPAALKAASTSRNLKQKLVDAAVGIARREARIKPCVRIVRPRPSSRREVAVGQSFDDLIRDLLADFGWIKHRRLLELVTTITAVSFISAASPSGHLPDTRIQLGQSK